MPRGSLPGERRGGRQKGARNKPKPEAEAVKAAALEYSVDSVHELARLAFRAKSDMVRVHAIHELLDRAIGKAPQAVLHGGNLTITHEQALVEIERRIRLGELAGEPMMMIGNGSDIDDVEPH